MQDEIFFDGVRYLSAADAARSSSFTRDYIARLCKDGILVGRKIGKGWYVKEDSLNEFLVIKTAGQAQRRISLAHERSHEYRLRTEARQAFPEAERGYDVHHALARAVVRSASVMPAGALDLAVRAIPSPHTASATATFLQKAMALFFAVALTFGTYTAVDPQYMRDLALNTARASTAVVASMRNIATQGMFAHTEQSGSIYTAAVGATGVSGALRATVDSFARSVYERVNSLAFSIAFPERLFGVRSGERATVAVGIASGARAQEVLASASSSPAQARAARTFAQTIVHQPVIQTVLERQSVVGGVSQEELGAALNILENKLSTRVYSLTAANSTQVADTYHVVAQTNRIDQLSRVSISDSNWTGGSISGASVSATNLAVSGVSGLATTTIGGALTITSGTASTNPFVVNNTLGTTVFAVANDGTLITNVASTTSSYSSLLVTGSATATNLVVLDTASSTNIFATNSTTTNATTTNLYASAFVSTNATTTNGYVENFVAQNATTTTLFSLNASTTNATSTNLYATLGHLVTGIIDSFSATVASITNITAINSTTTNATSTNLAVFTAPIAPAFIATSTTDTSVFNGNLTVGGTANFSGLLSFGIASTSQLSVFNKAYFGATATSTFDSAGNLSLVSNGLTVGANQLVASGGNIGIGITSPTSTLSVGGTTTIAFSQTDSASAATNFRGATYLGLGGQEYNPNSYRLIGFGYNNALSTNYYPAYMGYTETNSTGQTQGDLLFFTRNTTLGTASPTERLRITASGTIGIGTTTPATTLSVQGNQYTSGTAFFGGAVTATSTFTTTATAANTFPFASTTAITSATASTTALNISGTTALQSITASSLLYNNASQQVGAVSISSPLTFSAGTLSINTANANTWTALQQFSGGASSTLFSNFGTAYFGGTATSSFSSTGALTLVNALTYGGVTLSNAVTGTGNMVLSTSPTLTTPNLGTPSVLTLTNATGLPISTGVSGLGTGVATALGVNVGSAGAFVTFNGALGTPSSGTLTNATGLLPAGINLTKGNFLVGNDAGIAQATSTIFISSTGNVGVGTTTPGSLLSIGNTTGWNFYDNGTTTSYAKGIDLKNGGCFAVNGTCISGGSGTNYWTLSGSNLYNNSGTYIGIGTTTPWGLLSVNPNALGSGVPEFVVGSSTATHLIVTGAGNVGIGTSTPSGKLSIVAAASSWGGIKGYSSTRTNGFFMDFFSASTTIAYNGKVGGFVLNDDQNSAPGLVFKSYDQSFPILFATSHGGGAETTRMAITNSGNVGIGTTTPFRLLSLTAAVSTAQTAIAYDTTNNTDILTSSVGDLFVYPSGNDALFNNSNLWVCTGGSGATNGCPSGTPSGFGNLIVETALGVGSSTPFTALALGANMSIVTTEKALTDGATIAIDWKNGNQQVVTLGGNRAITFSNYIPGSTLRLVLCQDATGSRTITSWPAAVLWSGGSAPTLTTTANKCDVLTLLTTAATGTVRVLGSSVLNF